MDKNRINIAAIGHSDIIYEGITNLLHRHSDRYFIYRMEDIEELEIMQFKLNINVVIINPANIINRFKYLTRFRQKYRDIYWIAMVYTLFDNKLLNEFDDSLSINDTSDILLRKIDHSQDNSRGSVQNDLSDREKEVLIELARGLSNKEIADTLNISIHTVISHRKNISEKTGIKSLPGLTIYAISNNLVQLDNNS